VNTGITFETKAKGHTQIVHRLHLLHKKCYNGILSRVWVTIKTGFGLDDWIYWYLMRSTRNYRQYSAIAILHTSQFTVTHALGFSVFISRILATDLSQSHCHLKSHKTSSLRSLIHFLALFSIQSNSSAHKLISRQSGVSKLDSTSVLYSFVASVSFYNPSSRTTQKTQSVLLTRCVYRAVA
jgi:hypothetical protein